MSLIWMSSLAISLCRKALRCCWPDDQLLDHEVPDADDRHADERGDAEARVVGDLPALAPLLPVGEQVDHDH